jgi:hypothetical protein
VPVFQQQTAAILGQAAEKWPELRKHP